MEETIMARLPSITSKDQVAAKDRDTFDSIVASRGAVQGPFTMFLHSPEVAGRVADLGAYVRFEGSLAMRGRGPARRSGRDDPRDPRQSFAGRAHGGRADRRLHPPIVAQAPRRRRQL